MKEYQYAIVSPDKARATVTQTRAALNLTAFTAPLAPTVCHTIPTPPTKAERRRNHDRAVLRTSRPTDYAVYSSIGDDRRLCGFVRKADGAVMWRRCTDNGVGAWHVLRGYTKRMPHREMRRAFDIPQYVNVYMVDVQHVADVTARIDKEETHAAGPHDRRPQEYIYRGKWK